MYGIVLQGCMHFHCQGKVSGKNLAIHWLPNNLKEQLTFRDAISGSMLGLTSISAINTSEAKYWNHYC